MEVPVVVRDDHPAARIARHAKAVVASSDASNDEARSLQAAIASRGLTAGSRRRLIPLVK